jgi:chitodextrinase/lysophospholipase L1-like esterase
MSSSAQGSRTSGAKIAARPAVPVSGTLMDALENRTLFAGTGLAGAYFARTNLTLQKFARVDSTVDFHWDGGTPARSLGTDGFSVRWVGKVLAKFSENHTFLVSGNGGVRLWVNSQLIINDPSPDGNGTRAGSVNLSAGRRYDIRLEYTSDGNDPGPTLEWLSNRTPRQVVPKNRLYANRIDNDAPTAPTSVRAATKSDSEVALSWKPASDPSGIVGYDVYVGRSKTASLLAGQRSFVVGGLRPGTGYTFSVQAIDPSGNGSSLRTVASVTSSPNGNSRPSVPGNLRVTGVSDTTVSLEWDASNDPDGNLASYRVYRNGQKLGSAPRGTSFTDTNLSPDTNYVYTVRAADSSGLFSANSSGVNAQTNAGTSSQSRDAFAGLSGDSFDQGSGVGRSDGKLVGMSDGDWVLFRDVDFGSGARSVHLNMAADNDGGYLQFRLDDVNGTVIGTHDVQATGSNDTYFDQALNINTVTGTHDLYVVFRNDSDLGKIDSITFSSDHLVRIMAMGDSITQAFSGTPSYRYYLYNLLKNAGYGVDFVGSMMDATNGSPSNLNFDQNHEGHSGWRADELAAHAAEWAAEFKPEVLLLHAGSNDVEQGQSTDSTIGDLRNIINAVRSQVPNVKVLIAQIIPSAGHDAGVASLNGAIPSLASEMSNGQSQVNVVDMNSGFSLSDTFDGIHLTSAGESKMAQRWFDAITQII